MAMSLGMGSKDLFYLWTVERQVQTGADANLQYAASRRRQRSFAIRQEFTAAHRKIDDMRQNAVVVEAHGDRRAFSEPIV
jgi:hypothetical protein